jgi:hypothetical protein
LSEASSWITQQVHYDLWGGSKEGTALHAAQERFQQLLTNGEVGDH